MDVDAFAKTKGGKKGGKGKDKVGKSKKFEGHCFWCGVYGPMMEDCQKKAVGKPQVPKSPRGPDPKVKGEGKGGKGKKGASSQASGQTVRKLHRLMSKLPRMLQVSSLVLSVDMRGTVNETSKPKKESRNRHDISGHLTKWKPLCQCCRR